MCCTVWYPKKYGQSVCRFALPWFQGFVFAWLDVGGGGGSIFAKRMGGRDLVLARQYRSHIGDNSKAKWAAWHYIFTPPFT